MVPFVIGQKRKAMVAFDSAIKAISKAVDSSASGDHATAISLYNQAIESLRSYLHRQSPLTHSAWANPICAAMLGKARALVALDRRGIDFEHVERMMSDAFALKPDWPEALEFMVELAISHGQPEKARHYVSRLLAIDGHYQRARFLSAVLDFENRHYDAARHEFASFPESMSTLCYIARCHLRTGQFNAAIEVLERARLRFEETYECYYYLGCALGHAGRLEDARGVLGRLSRWTPRRTEVMVQQGNLYLISGWVSDAERCFSEAIKLGLGNPLPAYYGLALAASATGGNQFETRIERIRRFSPSSELLSCALGDRHERAGRLEEAIREYSSVPSHSAMAGPAAARLGFIHYRRGDFAHAVAALGEAARLRPWDNKLLDMLGAAAALAGDCRLAIKVWSDLPSRRTSDEKSSRALRAARLGIIAENINQGRTREAIEQLEDYYRQTEDPTYGRALADAHFAAALAALKADPPDVERTKKLLLLGKSLTTHPKFDYCLAISDLVEGNNESAAARLHAVLAAKAKNPGASYHLGLALLRSGDAVGAENALRYGVTVSFNRPSKLGRLKYALAALLAREERWAEAAAALEDFVPSEEADAQPTVAQATELSIRCLVMDGNWEVAEQVILNAPKGQQTALAAIILAWRNIEAGRLADASLCIDHYLRMVKATLASGSSMAEKARRALAPMALKAAAQEARRFRFPKAKTTLERALSALIDTHCSVEQRRALSDFIAALDDNQQPRVGHLVNVYESLDFEFALEKEDIRPPLIEIPVVLPPTPPAILDAIERPLFDPNDWDAAPYPDPLVSFDC